MASPLPTGHRAAGHHGQQQGQPRQLPTHLAGLAPSQDRGVDPELAMVKQQARRKAVVSSVVTEDKMLLSFI